MDVKRVIVVLGMHRSGTSAVTRAMSALGVELGDRLLPPAAGNNEKGFFEDADINELNIQMLSAIGSDWHCLSPVEPRDLEVLRQRGFFLRAVDLLRAKTSGNGIFAFKDPRVPKLLTFWLSVFEYCSLRVGYAIVVRNPLSVARSLMTRDALPYEKSYHLWFEHVVTSLARTSGSPRALVDYDQFLLDPKKYLVGFAKRLALKFDAAKFDEYEGLFLDSQLRHSVYQADDLELDARCPPIVRSLYSELAGISANNLILDDPACQTRHAALLEQFHLTPLDLRWVDGVMGAYSDLVTRTRSGFVNQDVVDQFHKTVGALIEVDVELLRPVFDASWYLRKYPDVAAAGVDPYQHFVSSGHLERRLPSEQPFGAILASLLNAVTAWSSQRAAAQALAEERLALLQERELGYRQRLQEVEGIHEERTARVKEDFAFRHQLLSTRCEELSAREVEHLAQLEDVRLQFEQTLSNLTAAHAAEISEQRRKAEGELANMAKRELAEMERREKAISRQVQELRSTGERERAELKRQHADRDKSYLMQLEQERERLSAATAEFSGKEEQYRHRLLALELAAEQQKAELLQRLRDRTVFSIIGSGLRNAFHPLRLSRLDGGAERARADDSKGLLAMKGEDFLHAAYLTVLGRPADQGGLQHYMARLEAGDSKASILETLGESAEGKASRAARPGISGAETDGPPHIGERQSQ